MKEHSQISSFIENIIEALNFKNDFSFSSPTLETEFSLPQKHKLPEKIIKKDILYLKKISTKEAIVDDQEHNFYILRSILELYLMHNHPTQTGRIQINTLEKKLSFSYPSSSQKVVFIDAEAPRAPGVVHLHSRNMPSLQLYPSTSSILTREEALLIGQYSLRNRLSLQIMLQTQFVSSKHTSKPF